MGGPHGEGGRDLEVSTVAARPGEPALRADLRVAALTILAHPDVSRVGERVLLPALGSGREVALSRREPIFAPPGGGAARPLGDVHVSRTPVVLAPAEAPGALRLVVDRGGSAVEVLGVVESPHEIARAALERGTAIVLADRIALLLHLHPAAAPPAGDAHGLVGESAAAVELRRAIDRVAEASSPVLLRGETGTGKELVARAIHDASRRRDRPYLALNLSAVPAALAAAELFGAERGSFTGADRRREGYFERADGGTLFLDEVGETPLEVQALLLRTLENGEIQPVGAATTRRVDVRVVAATDADLEAAVAAGRFRAPLLHRLRGEQIALPPLRARRDDVGRLLVAFLREELASIGREGLLADIGADPWLPARLVARLASFDWPGNVRELRNVARRLANAGRDRAQAELPADLEALLSGEAEGPPTKPEPIAAFVHATANVKRPRPSYRNVAEVRDEEILAALRACRYSVAAAAARLRVSRTALYGLLDRYPQVRKAADLGREEISDALARCGGDLDAAAAALEVSPHALRLRRTHLGMD